MDNNEKFSAIESTILQGSMLAFAEEALGLPKDEELTSSNVIDSASLEGDALAWYLVAISYNASIILISAQFPKTDTRPILDRSISYTMSYVVDVEEKTNGLIFESPIPLHKVVLNDNGKILILKDKKIDPTEYIQDIPEADD